MRLHPLALLALGTPLLLAACQATETTGAPGTSPQGFDAIGEGETIRFLGTEPFWGGNAKGDSLTYETPENPQGSKIAIKRFAGQGGLGLSGTLDGATFDMTVTPGECSDGMSDRTYPYTVTLKVGADQREGCAWTDAQPFEGPLTP